jgi:Holliday junction resolvase RusA-like endonuclease
MLTNLAFTVPGIPQGKGRGKIVAWGNKRGIKTPEKTVAYEGLVAHAATQAMAGHALLEGACMVEMDITCPVPASWSKKRQAAALAGTIYPTTKPDKDNVIKAIYDGMNGVVWRDDVQAVDGWQRKRYGAVPGVRVRVAVLGGVA